MNSTILKYLYNGINTQLYRLSKLMTGKVYLEFISLNYKNQLLTWQRVQSWLIEVSRKEK